MALQTSIGNGLGHEGRISGGMCLMANETSIFTRHRLMGTLLVQLSSEGVMTGKTQRFRFHSQKGGDRAGVWLMASGAFALRRWLMSRAVYSLIDLDVVARIAQGSSCVGE